MIGRLAKAKGRSTFFARCLTRDTSSMVDLPPGIRPSIHPSRGSFCDHRDIQTQVDNTQVVEKYFYYYIVLLQSILNRFFLFKK